MKYLNSSRYKLNTGEKLQIQDAWVVFGAQDAIRKLDELK